MSEFKAQLHLSPIFVKHLTPKPGFTVVSCSVGHQGEALRLFARSEIVKEVFARVQSAGFASFPISRSGLKYAAFLEVASVRSTYEIELHDLSAAFSFVQLLPEGKTLIAGARCLRFKDGTHELNAWVYDANGLLQNQFLLGDGIQHVQTDKNGNIWVGYFDEGVYGNFGWGGRGNAGPVGAAGLLCFNSNGEKIWEFQPASGTDSISDVYALNVFGNEAWVYYYKDFPLVRIGPDRRLEVWATKTSGARAFAIGNAKVLMFGGYKEKHTAARFLSLGHREAILHQSVALSLTDGGELAKATVIGRGNILHVLTDEVWYQFSTSSLT